MRYLLQAALIVSLSLLLIPSVRADWGCHPNNHDSAGGLPGCTDTGCAAAGGHCVMVDYHTNADECVCIDNNGRPIPAPPPTPCPVPPPKGNETGDGTADPLGLPSSPFDFSLASFEPGSPLTTASIANGAAGSVALSLVTFDTTIIFTETSDPSLLLAGFSHFYFEYVPFSIPGLGSTLLNRQILDLSLPYTYGLLNVDTGEMTIEAPTLWLTTTGTVYGTSVETFTIQIIPTSDPNLVNVHWTGNYEICPVPEPTNIFWLISLSILIVWRVTMRRICRVPRRSNASQR